MAEEKKTTTKATTKATTKKRNIYQKMLAVAEAVGRVSKGGRNEFHKYDYVTESDILEAIRPALISEGLTISVNVASIETERLTGDKGRATNECVVRVEYTIRDADDPESFVKCMVPGVAQDTGDKALYKALTGSQKYFFLKNFMISSGDDPERESGAPRQARTPAPAPRAGGGGRPATEKQIGFIKSLMIDLEMTDGEVIAMKRAHGFESIDDLDAGAASDLISKLKSLNEEYAATGERPALPGGEPVDLYSAEEIAGMFDGDVVE